MSVGFHTLLKQDVQSTQHVGNQVINLEKTVISPKFFFMCYFVGNEGFSHYTVIKMERKF